ncbi:MAG: 50S ribosomal protein L25/general stress protein Ctc [Leptolyngbyaceae cyanobacterium SL_1_1]|nr:50S ribosomal protein L25/general stress protein Ctc [Leptolyngbyaceae cyanobacterium RM2_2_21]NJN01764.1 50S ribosomal protein L25/general stress protein Ctc [Leptolyngbyaceae cyanobacterium RM1_1_2]NJO09947.1 50S ribosomal protein L25/general stress protein Ctc [Leptolyngbyaceae cyanobacterium SL_1_1]
MDLSIQCQTRDLAEKPKAIRRDGRLPAVLYGHKGAESISLTINAKDAATLMRYASVNNTLVTVEVPDIKWSGKALLREVQTHPWKNIIEHVSFFSIAAQDEVEVVVPLSYVGEAAGVSNDGGTLDTLVNDLAIKCPPGSIPETIEIDVSNLQVGDILRISDLTLPAGVIAVADLEKSVVTVLSPTVGAESEAETELVDLVIQPEATDAANADTAK